MLSDPRQIGFDFALWPVPAVREAVFDTALGPAVVTWSDRGVSRIDLGWRSTRILTSGRVRVDEWSCPWRGVVEALAEGADPAHEVPLDVEGTQFQRQVWAALRGIPRGETRTYTQLAEQLGKAPTASRAVAGACAANPVALLVPCHRIIRTDGGLGGFRWGIERKRRLLEAERG